MCSDEVPQIIPATCGNSQLRGRLTRVIIVDDVPTHSMVELMRLFPGEYVLVVDSKDLPPLSMRDTLALNTAKICEQFNRSQSRQFKNPFVENPQPWRSKHKRR